MSDLVTVFQSSDIALLALAKAALDQAGIRYVSDAEGTQDLFGVGRLFSGYNQLLGPPRIRVAAENEARAREALSDLIP